MKLPTNYTTLTPKQRRLVREEYIKIQNGICSYCNEPLDSSPNSEVMSRYINVDLFPPNFFMNPIHLHHDHKTGMTLGAVHCQCNAVLWQYYGE